MTKTYAVCILQNVLLSFADRGHDTHKPNYNNVHYHTSGCDVSPFSSDMVSPIASKMKATVL